MIKDTECDALQRTLIRVIGVLEPYSKYLANDPTSDKLSDFVVKTEESADELHKVPLSHNTLQRIAASYESAYREIAEVARKGIRTGRRSGKVNSDTAVIDAGREVQSYIFDFRKGDLWIQVETYCKKFKLPPSSPPSHDASKAPSDGKAQVPSQATPSDKTPKKPK